ncbi:replicative helicase loader/inhibitor [Robertmurraya sp. DFI.2.37]|uniref:replicative helicase loader/inhibitor n=1 Tax=Robertmurraya TaxID=2837507 RepID=UPI0010F7C879|nr:MULTISPECIES: replicative helicase loader/inhibitor [Robertmurraya]MDF1507644.1 replicative helicase loader/inhibitor [Robertmurraya sp. DFI.2.37]
MNRKEIINLLGIATANFPNMQNKEMTPTAILWEKSLSDLSYEVAEKAVIKVLSTSRFFPTIADIREAAAQITQPRTLDAMEAWGLIGQAIRKYGFYRQKEAMESLPEDVREMVKRFTWRELCLSEEPEILRAQFRKAWEIQSKRATELKALPIDIRNLIEGVSEGMKLIE